MKKIENNNIAKLLMLHREFFFAGVEPLIGKNADRLIQNTKFTQWQKNYETSMAAQALKEKHLHEIQLFYQNVDKSLHGINIYKQNFIRRILWQAHLHHYRNAIYYECGLRGKVDYVLTNTKIINHYYHKMAHYLMKH